MSHRDSHRIPVIRLWGNILALLQGEILDSQASALTTDVLNTIRSTGASGLVVDISGLDTVDSHVCAMLANLAAAARFMGVTTFVSGVSPLVAITLEQMGLSLNGVRTTLGLEEAMSELLGPEATAGIQAARSTQTVVEEALKHALLMSPSRTGRI